MKKYFLSSAMVLCATTAFGSPSDLGIPTKVVDALESNSMCAKIVETGQEIELVVSGGFVIGRSGSDWIRFVTFKRALPLKGNAVTMTSSKVVNVVACEGTAVKVPAKPVMSVVVTEPEVREKEVVILTPAKKKVLVKQPETQVVEIRDFSPASSDEKKFHQPLGAKPDDDELEDEAQNSVAVRGIFEAINTFNVSYAKYSKLGSEEKDRSGHGWNVKARVRPLQIGNAKVGVYGTLSDGHGESYASAQDRTSSFDYRTYGFGASMLYDHGNDNYSEADLGVLWNESHGWRSDKPFESWQDENMMEARYTYGDSSRREAGELLFPYWEAYGRYLHPFNVDYRDTNGGDNAYDNRRLRFGGMLDVYDWYIDDQGKWRLTPTFNAELGYLWGKSSGYIQGGPGAKLGWRGKEVVDLRFLNPQFVFEGNGSRLYNYIGTVKIDNLTRAGMASGTKNYKPAKKEGSDEVVILTAE